MDDEIEALDNVGNILQNTVAQSANMGAFNLVVSPINEFTLLNTDTMKMDNNAPRGTKAANRMHEYEREEDDQD
ncbi:MAG: hypothetical protein Q8930_00390 [Bacillota bacterium]|nr:hypothetical protein [Bacillota bacterium]